MTSSPRSTGYLMQMPFEEGAEVKKGDLLFEVDPRPYKAQLDQAQGQVDLYKAQLKLAMVNLARNRAIESASPGSVSQQQFDQGQAVVDEASARVNAAERSMELYRLNYEFTRVVSPIDGQSSRYYKTLGNLVNQDQTLLTTVVSVDPMYVYFEMDEPTLCAVLEGSQRTEGSSRARTGARCRSHGAARRGRLPAPGDHQSSSITRAIARRALPCCERSSRTRCPKGAADCSRPACSRESACRSALPHRALLVRDRAIASDQGLKYVYVLDAENKVQSRRVNDRCARGRRPEGDRGRA